MANITIMVETMISIVSVVKNILFMEKPFSYVKSELLNGLRD